MNNFEPIDFIIKVFLPVAILIYVIILVVYKIRAARGKDIYTTDDNPVKQAGSVLSYIKEEFSPQVRWTLKATALTIKQVAGRGMVIAALLTLIMLVSTLACIGLKRLTHTETETDRAVYTVLDQGIEFTPFELLKKLRWTDIKDIYNDEIYIHVFTNNLLSPASLFPVFISLFSLFLLMRYKKSPPGGIEKKHLWILGFTCLLFLASFVLMTIFDFFIFNRTEHDTQYVYTFMPFAYIITAFSTPILMTVSLTIAESLAEKKRLALTQLVSSSADHYRNLFLFSLLILSASILLIDLPLIFRSDSFSPGDPFSASILWETYGDDLFLIVSMFVLLVPYFIVFKNMAPFPAISACFRFIARRPALFLLIYFFCKTLYIAPFLVIEMFGSNSTFAKMHTMLWLVPFIICLRQLFAATFFYHFFKEYASGSTAILKDSNT
ncbi:MAG TPA: hypothetical protein PLN69_08850 [bacterium]|nr:hypothetical protein [bacterium]